MIVRRLNEDGVRRFGQFLDSLSSDRPDDIPSPLLQDPQYSEELTIPTQIDIDQRTFDRRFDAAKYLYDKLDNTGLRDIERDIGLWSWLALFYFETLCSKSRNGRWIPGERSHWIPSVDDWRRYCRHFLAGGFRIYRSHRDDPSRAMVLLYHSPQTIGHFVYQLAQRQELIVNSAVIETATRLYYDSSTGRGKRGAQTEKTSGSVFRFTIVLNQLDLTWDLQRLTSSQLLAMLPAEFDRFKSED